MSYAHVVARPGDISTGYEKDEPQQNHLQGTRALTALARPESGRETPEAEYQRADRAEAPARLKPRTGVKIRSFRLEVTRHPTWSRLALTRGSFLPLVALFLLVLGFPTSPHLAFSPRQASHKAVRVAAARPFLFSLCHSVSGRMMKVALYLTPLLASLGCALPQATPDCETTTVQEIEPTSTATYASTFVTTIQASTAKDLGTFTDIVRVSSTRTVVTVTEPASACADASTEYSSSAAPSPTGYEGEPSGYKRALGLNPRQDSACTVTETSTTTYGQTYTYLPASETSTYTRYTAFTQATVTSTTSGGTAYAAATATAEPSDCPATVTYDARCAPSAIVSAAGGENDAQFGLQYTNDVTVGGAVYKSNTTDASACCQQCAGVEGCSASVWDSRTGSCKLEFPVEYGSGGDLTCGLGGLVFYDAGPASPMEPGTGLFVAEVCGSVQFTNAKPDDGS